MTSAPAVSKADAEAAIARRFLLPFARRMIPSYAPEPFHGTVARALTNVRKGNITRLMISMPPRHGKALDCATPIPTPSGWTTMGELRPGDFVFDDAGRPTEVVAVSGIEPDRPVYRVQADDGSVVVADADHLWRARLDGKRPVYHLHTSAVLARPRRKRAMIETAKPLDLPEAWLPIEPYVLGLWLGDGHSDSATITAGDADGALLRRAVEEAGFRVTSRATVNTFGVLGLQAKLRASGLVRNKHIPWVYLRASAEQRLRLLQGLIDSDGYVAPDGQVEFTTIKRNLAEQVRELVFTLGVKASLIEGRATQIARSLSPKYRIMFYMRGAARLPRKAARCRDGVKTPGRYVSAVPCGRSAVRCIQVAAASGMFLAGRGFLPTHNSQLASVIFPPHYLGHCPDRNVILCSYSGGLAATFGGRARALMLDERYPFPGVRLSPGSQARDRWTIAGHKGGLVAVGTRGSITGHGADLALIDDPVAGAAEAESPTVRDSTWEWYLGTLYTRLEAGDAAIVVIMTRWHEDDLGGRLLRDMAQGGDRWVQVTSPALAPENSPDGRRTGAALWPARFNRERLERIRDTIGTRYFESLYQQNPRPPEGSLFKREWFKVVDAIPEEIEAGLTWYRYWDLAVQTGNMADYTASAAVAMAPDGTVFIRDVIRGRWEWPDASKIIKANMIAEPKTRHTIEEAIHGTAALQEFRRDREIAHVPLRGYKPDRDKVSRALAWSGRAEAGKVALVRGPWITAFLNEVLAFPLGAHDDQVDSVSGSVAAFGRGGVGIRWL